MLALARGLAVTEMKSHCKNNALSVLSKGAKLVQCNKVVSDGVIEEVSVSEKPFLFFIDGGKKVHCGARVRGARLCASVRLCVRATDACVW